MYLFVRVSILPLSTIFLLDFGNVLTVWYFFLSSFALPYCLQYFCGCLVQGRNLFLFVCATNKEETRVLEVNHFDFDFIATCRKYYAVE